MNCSLDGAGVDRGTVEFWVTSIPKYVTTGQK